MHRIETSVRRIAPADLPRVRDGDTRELREADQQELLNMGIVHLAADVYSCIEQHVGEIVYDPRERRDVRVFKPLEGEAKPGEILTAGDVRERYTRLPADVRPKVLRATVIRATNPDVKVVELVEANLLEQATVIEASVGDVIAADGSTAPLVDFESPNATLEEAQRLAAIPDNGIERVTVAMVDVVREADVVEAENQIPHAWAGERVVPL